MQFEALRAIEFLLYLLAFFVAGGSYLLFRANKKLCSAVVLIIAAVIAMGIQIATHFFTLTEKEDVKQMSATMLRQQGVIHNTDLSEMKPQPKEEVDLEAMLAKEKAKSAEAAKGL